MSLVKRHLAKTITWRVVATVDTTIIGWVISGDRIMGLSIGGAEVITKMAFYFIHERGWLKVGKDTTMYKYRHIIKSISWRIIGTADTILLTWLITDNLQIGFKVGAIEILTKMLLYFMHERAWHKFDFGVKNHL